MFFMPDVFCLCIVVPGDTLKRDDSSQGAFRDVEMYLNVSLPHADEGGASDWMTVGFRG